MVIMYKSLSDIVKDLEIFKEVSLSGEDLSILSVDEIKVLNKMIMYGEIATSISFDFGDEYVSGVEIRCIEKTRKGKVLVCLWFHDDWEEAEWMVKRLREIGVRAKLDTDVDKAIVLMELKNNMYIYIEKQDEFY